MAFSSSTVAVFSTPSILEMLRTSFSSRRTKEPGRRASPPCQACSGIGAQSSEESRVVDLPSKTIDWETCDDCFGAYTTISGRDMKFLSLEPFCWRLSLHQFGCWCSSRDGVVRSQVGWSMHFVLLGSFPENSSVCLQPEKSLVKVLQF